MEQYRITPGGWPAFSEERGVNTKEIPEMFDWLPAIETTFYGTSDKYFLEVCRDALDRVEGSREWLKGHEGDFTNCEMADRLIADMTLGEYASYGHSILYMYRALLADWDGWVYNQKRSRALLSYRAQQPPVEHIESLIDSCKSYEEHEDSDLEHEIKYYCGLMCISGCVTELREILLSTLDELRGPPLEDSPPAPPLYYPFLPLGAHLLPSLFQGFLKRWNLEITKNTGSWLGTSRKAYQKLFPEKWKEFQEENQRLTELYADGVAALKKYQALHSIQPD